MEVSYPATVKDCLIIHPDLHDDERGLFAELFHKERYLEDATLSHEWVQVNCSRSKKGVLRGLHIAPFAKLVTCLRGSIFDVVADVREDSPTFKKHVGLYMDGPHRQIYVPPGCAHGFVALEDNTVVMYMQSGMYDPALDKSVRWDDPKLAIPWPTYQGFTISEKDQSASWLK